MEKDRVLKILNKDIGRISNVKFTDSNPDGQVISFQPFYTSISLREIHEQYFEMDRGDLLTFQDSALTGPAVFGHVEFRMGDYKKGGGSGTFSARLSKNLRSKTLRHHLWENETEAGWECVTDYEGRVSSARGVVDKEERQRELLFFSKEKKIISSVNKAGNLPPANLEEIKETLTLVHDKLDHPSLFGLKSIFDGYNEERAFVNSEGSEIYDSSQRWSISLEMSCLKLRNGAVGSVIPIGHKWRMNDVTRFPSFDDLLEKGEELKEKLSLLSKAKVQKSGEYPVIFCPVSFGTVLHEAFGHATEAQRLQSGAYWKAQSTIFKDKLGDKIAPDFITVVDDPTVKGFFGSYNFDDEGVPAQRVTLIKNGVLNDYLHSRQSAGYFGERFRKEVHSNGHSRAEPRQFPIPRMGHLIVNSENEVEEGELIEDLKKKAKDGGYPYGLYIKDATSGYTEPDEEGAGRFFIFPQLAYRIYPNGKEEAVWKFKVTGSPYQTLRSIVKTSDDYRSSEGLCGAESGFIPVSGYNPHVLVDSIDINELSSNELGTFPKPFLSKPKL